MDYIADEAENIQAAVPVASTHDTFLQNPKSALCTAVRGNKHLDYSPSASCGF
ncbi:hypothetical protein CKAH01_17014 [Colletotrichum kahawae]|uniref:Uncharacterized protein n=1 Tax=Colletotrichum kahawae TaxID=34407 RepID=A0AAE0D5S0_COLKA|nr:hypothetical protein CKAH01_17014 [Colletotrichum kahawae]